jgi:predicted Zn-dependent protease
MNFKVILYSVGMLMLLSSCARNPVTGKKEVSFMSESQEISMGKQYDPSIVAQYGVYQNTALQAFITEKGKQMAAISHRPNLPYEFKILDSPIVNAFAVPGGYVYFTQRYHVPF